MNKKIYVVFYRNKNGIEPVKEWLLSIDSKDRSKIGADLKTVEYGFPIGMPVCKKLDSNLYEVRTNLKDKIARVLFCIGDGKMILLHGFIKKTQKTPAKDLDLARDRFKKLISK